MTSKNWYTKDYNRSGIWTKNFYILKKLIGTWQNLHRKTHPPLSQTELNSIKSFNDRINLQDVRDVYLPLTNLIGIYKVPKKI